MIDPTESSPAVTVAGPRYGEPNYYSYLSSPKDRNPSVYYRVYTQDGAIPTVNPVYSDDPYLGRISARCVAPPHTASSLRRCLSNVQNISTGIQTNLFIATSSEAPMNDSDRVSILAHTGPGHTANEPVALVISSLPTNPLLSHALFQLMSIPAHSGSGYRANKPMVSSSFARMFSSDPRIGRSAEQGPTPFEVQYCELYWRCPRLLIALISCSSVLPSL